MKPTGRESLQYIWTEDFSSGRFNDVLVDLMYHDVKHISKYADQTVWE